MVVGFAAGGAALLLFILLLLLATRVGTSPEALWQALTDPQVLAALGLTFYAAAWATGLAIA